MRASSQKLPYASAKWIVHPSLCDRRRSASAYIPYGTSKEADRDETIGEKKRSVVIERTEAIAQGLQRSWRPFIVGGLRALHRVTETRAATEGSTLLTRNSGSDEDRHDGYAKQHADEASDPVLRKLSSEHGRWRDQDSVRQLEGSAGLNIQNNDATDVPHVAVYKSRHSYDLPHWQDPESGPQDPDYVRLSRAMLQLDLEQQQDEVDKGRKAHMRKEQHVGDSEVTPKLAIAAKPMTKSQHYEWLYANANSMENASNDRKLIRLHVLASRPRFTFADRTRPTGDLHPNMDISKISADFPRVPKLLQQQRIGKASFSVLPPPNRVSCTSARCLHTSARLMQQAFDEGKASEAPNDGALGSFKTQEVLAGIRAQLREWEVLHADEEAKYRQREEPEFSTSEVFNDASRLPSESLSSHSLADEEEEGHHAFQELMRNSDDVDGGTTDARFLKIGDLVELSFARSERDSVIAIFVRRWGAIAQLFTMHGKWINVLEKGIQYSIPDWVSPSLVEPLLDRIPNLDQVEDLSDLQEESLIHDLSIPRKFSAPLVKRMQQFHNESQLTYRRHAHELDNAHQILAHETDLRYGSLTAAATLLLKTPTDKLPLTALYTTRSALYRAGFCFAFDSRSHRLTGYMQIRSKEQVRMIETVRRWCRAWQDDRAVVASMREHRKKKHRPTREARYIYTFIEKAKTVVLGSREDREATFAGNIGPSKKRYPISSKTGCIRMTAGLQFSEQDSLIIRFLEAFSCTHLLSRHPHLLALPPLLLQATGLYESHTLDPRTGWLFLQELGVLTPYENRIRYDPNLLLPSSEHSRPLQDLMTSVLQLQDSHGFEDSLAHLRHDWGSLPVYCIDDASAREIDDGISVENGGLDDQGQELHWIHIHVANPTAFFSRDHALSRLARHMGETIYMPEGTHMMLPQWASSQHFSLASCRPCLTFSAKVNENGEVVHRKITPGTVRNVIRLTGKRANEILGGTNRNPPVERVVTVGGEPPSPQFGEAESEGNLTSEHISDIKLLHRLCTYRWEKRRSNGAVAINTPSPNIEIWQNQGNPGLGWDRPSRRGVRHVEGDPVIQIRCKEVGNPFKAGDDPSPSMVRECMLLASDIAGVWCAERQIPIIYRGTVHRPDQEDPIRYVQETIKPAAEERSDGCWPFHQHLFYMRLLGAPILSTTPLRHRPLGMTHFTRVTSPLRRYSDMVTHWQIQAALLQEASTGRSLVTQEQGVNRGFLPFSSDVLERVNVGLQPRENVIKGAKSYAESFWMSMALFRAIHYGEAEVGLPLSPRNGPIPTPSKNPFIYPLDDTEHFLPFDKRYIVHVYLHAPPSATFTSVNGVAVEFGLSSDMLKPEDLGLEQAQHGDLWEAEILKVDVYRRVFRMRPLRLVGRSYL